MSNIEFQKIPLHKLFESKRGNSKYTKKYCFSNAGIYEVYTGTTKGSFGKISTYDYDTPNLTYTTDGEYAGTVSVLDGKYNIGGHRAILISKDKNICLDYFKYVLEPMFKNVVKGGSVPSITWNIIKNLEIPVPLNKDNTYNFKKQEEMANKYENLLQQQSKLIEHKNSIENSIIEADFAKEYNHKEYLISELFIPCNGGVKYTKNYCNRNRGEYPVYSGNTREEFSFINTYDYNGKYLTWSIDGLAGYIKTLSGKFSITNHRGILIPKDTTDSDNLDVEYLKYIIEPIFRKNIKGRMGHNGQNEYTSLKLNAVNKIKQKIAIPIKEDGTFDLEAQREIANKYKKIEEIENGIVKRIDELVDVKISII